jgi:hypothetical protein
MYCIPLQDFRSIIAIQFRLTLPDLQMHTNSFQDTYRLYRFDRFPLFECRQLEPSHMDGTSCVIETVP